MSPTSVLRDYCCTITGGSRRAKAHLGLVAVLLVLHQRLGSLQLLDHVLQLRDVARLAASLRSGRFHLSQACCWHIASHMHEHS